MGQVQAACKRAPRLAPTCLVNGPIPRGRVIIPGPPAVPGAHAVGGCRCPGPSAGPWHPLSSSSPPALAWPTQVLVLGGPWPSCVCAPLAWDLALCPLLPPLQVRAQPRSDPDPEPAPRPRRSRPHFSPRLPGQPPQPSLEKLDGAQRGHRPGKLWSRLRSRPRGLGTRLRLQPSQGSSSSGSQKVGPQGRPRSNPGGLQGGGPAGRAGRASRRRGRTAPSAGVRGELHGGSQRRDSRRQRERWVRAGLQLTGRGARPEP